MILLYTFFFYSLICKINSAKKYKMYLLIILVHFQPKHHMWSFPLSNFYIFILYFTIYNKEKTYQYLTLQTGLLPQFSNANFVSLCHNFFHLMYHLMYKSYMEVLYVLLNSLYIFFSTYLQNQTVKLR